MTFLEIAGEVFERVWEARFAAVVALGVDNRRAVEPAAECLSQATDDVVASFGDRDPEQHPAIAAWREAFRELGWSPSTYLSSVEALVRRTLRGKPPPSINPAVDLANSVSLRYLVPIGAHDLGTAPLGLTVRLARPGDRFLPMGNGPEEVPEPGEIVYAHGSDIRTRRWVWRQSRTGLVTPDMTDCSFRSTASPMSPRARCISPRPSWRPWSRSCSAARCASGGWTLPHHKRLLAIDSDCPSC